MVIETFKDRNEIYHRLAERGRMMPAGLNYLSSWVQTDFKKCFQLMETEDFTIFDDWIANWNDLVEFEIIPVMTSKEGSEKVVGNKI